MFQDVDVEIQVRFVPEFRRQRLETILVSHGSSPPYNLLFLFVKPACMFIIELAVDVSYSGELKASRNM